MNTKKLWSLVCLAMAFTLLFTCAFAETAAVAPAAQAETEAVTYLGSGTAVTEITLRLVTLDGEILFDGLVTVIDDNPTVYMALKAAAEAAGLTLDVSGEETPDMMFLNGINDLASENPAFWMFYVNKEMALLGMGTQPIAQGDVVEFLYGDYSVGYVEILAAE